MKNQILIVIPARYASTRFPGKPLIKIAGKEMLLRVWENAVKSIKDLPDCKIIVASEDERIAAFCYDYKMEFLMTSDKCKSGSDRVCEVLDSLSYRPDFIVNLQGDNPMCPPWIIRALLDAFLQNPLLRVVTPVVQMSWQELDNMRKAKLNTPFSGTCAIADKDMNAVWFSKNIIPAIRPEAALRQTSDLSPVLRHIGLYAYSFNTLKSFAKLPESTYERLEGLEQLRFIENGIPIRLVKVDYKGYGSMSGIDSPQDVIKAESLFEKYGEFK